MKELKLYLRLLFSPSCWKKYGPTNYTWDKILRELMEENAPIVFGTGYSDDKLGSVPVDLNGIWYSFGNSVNNNGNVIHPRNGSIGSAVSNTANFIPPNWTCSRRTKLLLKDYLEKHCMSEYKKQNSKLAKALK